MTAWNEPTTAVVHWIYRDFSSCDTWKKKGRQLFLQVSGDSEPNDSIETRNRLGKEIRDYMVSVGADTVKVTKWKADFSGIIAENRNPPLEGNYADVDWRGVADYVLLAACNEWSQWEEEYARRRTINLKRKRAYEKELKKNADAVEPEYLPMLSLYEPL